MYNQYPSGPTNEGNNYDAAYANAGVPVPPAYPGSAPGYPGGQPPAYPGVPPQPAGWTSPPPPRQKSSAKPVLITLSIILVLALVGGGVAFYFLTRPNPLMSVTSTYVADASH